MSLGKLADGPYRFAFDLGRAAADDIAAGRIPARCRWSGDDPSLTKRRLAGAWSVGFESGLPNGPTDEQ